MNSYNTDPRESFENFLLAEYEHISDAHFETGQQASTYFNYYLLVLAAPVIITSLTNTPNLKEILRPDTESFEQVAIHVFTIAISFMIWLIGLFIKNIIISLQFDSVLYARTVNGIRFYFYERSGIDPTMQNQIRVLPTSIGQPSFYKLGNPIAWTFTIANTAYLLLSAITLFEGKFTSLNIFILLLLTVVSTTIHLRMSKSLARKKENKYVSPGP